MALQNFSDYMKNVSNQTPSSTKSSISYFTLKDDGDSAYIILDVEKLDDLIIHSGHVVYIDAIRQNRFINCLNDDINGDNCPFCIEGSKADKISSRVYRATIPICILENGDINEISYGVWNPSARLLSKLLTDSEVTNKLNDVDDLRSVVFILTRTGRDSNGYPTYSLKVAYKIPSGQNKIDFSPLNNVDIGAYVQDRSAEEMSIFIKTGDFPGYGKNRAKDENVSSPSPFVKQDEADEFDMPGNDHYAINPEKSTPAIKFPTNPTKEGSSTPIINKSVRRWNIPDIDNN